MVVAALAAIQASASLLSAQAAAVPTANSAPHKALHKHKSPTTPQSKTAPVQVAQPTPAPIAPPLPEWPINEKATEATIAWDSHGLSINATNSSMDQILQDVSTVTGIKFEGFGADQRVFGSYGPGSAHDVITQLIEGFGYNVLMIGDQGQGVPRQILLTFRQTGPAQPSNHTTTANNDEDSDAEEPPPQPPQMPNRPGLMNGGNGRMPPQFQTHPMPPNGDQGPN